MFENVRYCGAGKFISHGEWIHPDRVIDSYEIIFVTKGEVYINENNVEYLLKKNEILVLQPALRHYGYRSSTNTEFFWLHWYGSPKLPPYMKHRKIANPYGISIYLRQILEARVMQKSSEALDYLTRLVLIEFYSNSHKPNVNHIAEKISAWLDTNSHLAITDTQIAAQFGYNVDYLNRMFKANFSKTLKQYVNDNRMKYIKNLMLCEDLTLKEIAEKSGFAEYKYFLKFFKYHEGITPTQFFNQNAKLHINSH